MVERIAPHPSSARAPSREGKRAVTTYVSLVAYKQIRQLSLDTETSVQDLCREGLNLMFKKYKLDQIA